MRDVEFKVIAAKILQVVPLPTVMVDVEGNLTIALALCEFTIKWEDNVDLVVKRDLFPVGSDGGVRELPGDDAYYLLHAFGDISHDKFMEVAPADVVEASYDEMRQRRWAKERGAPA